jgi:hypothetical protein
LALSDLSTSFWRLVTAYEAGIPGVFRQFSDIYDIKYAEQQEHLSFLVRVNILGPVDRTLTVWTIFGLFLASSLVRIFKGHISGMPRMAAQKFPLSGYCSGSNCCMLD